VTGAGLALGALAGGGAWLAVTGVPWLRRPSLDDRLAPYLRDTPRPSRLLLEQRALTPFPTLERILRPALADLTSLLDRALGGVASARRRLEQAGRGMTLEQFRAEQIVWGGGGLLAGLSLALLSLARGGGTSPLALLLLTLLLAVGGVLARDRWLSREVARRQERMTAEFPTVAELLALAVAAGEGPAGALERLVRTSSGELSRELARAMGDVRAGASLVSALEALAARGALPALARFVDGVAIAVERGTPLAEVLRAQAVDVREASRRALLEAGGRKEIAMMVPVVFLVLPMTVLFALFPSFYGFTLNAP
jgi:tight adherence protein C